MNTIVEKMTGLDKLTDQVIASDLLAAAKTAVKSYAYVLTESVSQEVRDLIKSQLNEEMSFQEQMTDYMVKSGYYHAYDMPKQIKMDLQNAEQLLQMMNK
jgi:similar to spore coat protein